MIFFSSRVSFCSTRLGIVCPTCCFAPAPAPPHDALDFPLALSHGGGDGCHQRDRIRSAPKRGPKRGRADIIIIIMYVMYKIFLQDKCRHPQWINPLLTSLDILHTHTQSRVREKCRQSIQEGGSSSLLVFYNNNNNNNWRFLFRQISTWQIWFQPLYKGFSMEEIAQFRQIPTRSTSF
jgi:phage pi2 protein 07